MRKVTAYCDGCDKADAASITRDDDDELRLNLPHGWSGVTNSTGSYDLCPACLSDYSRNLDPRRWPMEPKKVVTQKAEGDYL